jgi:hypothetical protein
VHPQERKRRQDFPPSEKDRVDRFHDLNLGHKSFFRLPAAEPLEFLNSAVFPAAVAFIRGKRIKNAKLTQMVSNSQLENAPENASAAMLRGPPFLDISPHRC